MTKICVSEYRSLPTQAGQMVACGNEPAVAEWELDIGLTSVQSAEFHPQTKFIRLRCGAECCLKFGVDPEALPNLKVMTAGATEMFGVQPGHKLAVIANS